MVICIAWFPSRNLMVGVVVLHVKFKLSRSLSTVGFLHISKVNCV